ncbi:hypothetical protein [Vulcanisaeta sp. JCM 16159]|uniref:hypothetical protein n=1 Tax=Vulcanisaeta sp. JCM 16159 TaxID=1295371 RepID=UPI001FB3370F|nr:hypothetical protein [Vulcanisaeta sp. JCM 16159]
MINGVIPINAALNSISSITCVQRDLDLGSIMAMCFGPPWVMKAYAIWVGLMTLGEDINGASVGTGVLKMNCGFCEYEVILMIISTLG